MGKNDNEVDGSGEEVTEEDMDEPTKAVTNVVKQQAYVYQIVPRIYDIKLYFRVFRATINIKHRSCCRAPCSPGVSLYRNVVVCALDLTRV
jgi:hypothetical protein